jgi:integral membrane protein
VEDVIVSIDRTFLRRLRTLSIVEGISTLVLFGVAMPLKYLADKPMAVTIVGAIHGFLFMALVVTFLVGMRRIPLSPRLTMGGIAGAVVPFGPFVVDRWLVRVGESVV